MTTPSHAPSAAEQTRPSCCSGRSVSPSGTDVRDPVCGMSVDPHTAVHRTDYHGHPYYFCSARCREKFEAEPDRYLGPAASTAPVPAGTIYTCPMHPEVRQVGPGRGGRDLERARLRPRLPPQRPVGPLRTAR